MAHNRSGLALIAVLAAAPAFALNTDLFKDAPISRLDAEEIRVFRAFVFKTLDQTPDRTTTEWKAQKATFTSKITPQRSFSEGGVKCREAIIESDSRDRYFRGTWEFCRKKNGDWEFKAPSGKR